MRNLMNCPACTRRLTERAIGSLRVNVCEGGCGGLWFDTFEWKHVRDENEAGGAPLFRITSAAQVKVRPFDRRMCPRCAQVRLKHVLFNPGSTAHVDECPKCGGYWLDDGELAKIHDEAVQNAAKNPADESNAAADLIRYLYEVRTGDHRKKRRF